LGQKHTPTHNKTQLHTHIGEAFGPGHFYDVISHNHNRRADKQEQDEGHRKQDEGAEKDDISCRRALVINLEIARTKGLPGRTGIYYPPAASRSSHPRREQHKRILISKMRCPATESELWGITQGGSLNPCSPRDHSFRNDNHSL